MEHRGWCIFFVLAIAVTAVNVATIGSGYVQGPTSPDSIIGERFEADLEVVRGRQETTLQEMLRPCNYIVVGLAECAACRAAARRWSENSSADGLGRGWWVAWLLLSREEPARDFAVGLPASVLRAKKPSELAAEWGVQAVPSHLVLDSAGVVLAAAFGAPQATEDFLSDFCSRR